MPFNDPERARAYKKAWYLSRRDEQSERKKLAYRADPIPAKIRCHKYREANRELYLAFSKKYSAAHYANHVDKHRAYSKAYREGHRVELARSEAAYRQKHKREQSERNARRRAQKKNTEVEKINFTKILFDSNGVCGICKQPFDLFGIDFDHIIPLARGGTHTTNNIQATHSRCNRAKGAKVG